MSLFSEKILIEYIADAFAGIGNGTAEGIGDDCAIVPLSKEESMVFTTDMLCEGVHFLREAASAEEIGYKALAVNLSDVAAMGARPVATMLSIAVPPDCGKDWAFGFVDGFRNLSRQYDVALIGGDTVGSSHGITINVVAIGKIDNRCIKRRRDAKAGDVIVVNDFLGDSAAGLADVLGGRYHTPEARIHHHPVPQIDEGIWLGGRTEVHAMMDISDGLFSDLPHILELSHTGACVQIDRIPTRRTIEQAVCGGEDYKLLFTADADRFESLAADYKARFGSELYPVGRITSETGKLHWMNGEKEIEPDFTPFKHF